MTSHACKGILLALCLFSLTLQGLAATDCVDVVPPKNKDGTQLTCQEQKDLDKCEKEWMKDGGYCKVTCGVCKASDSTPAASAPATESTAVQTPVAEQTTSAAAETSTPQQTEVADETAPTVAATPTKCEDLPPPGDYTCAEQKKFGACEAEWLQKGNFCHITCGVCSPPPAAEQYRMDLQEQASLLSGGIDAESPGAVMELPTITLPTATTPQNSVIVERPPVATAAPTNTAPVRVPPIDVSLIDTPSDEEPASIASRRSSTTASGVTCDPEGPTAWEVVNTNPELTTFAAALKALNLVGVLSNPDITYTVFAPTNRGWEVAALNNGLTIPQLLQSSNLLRDIIFTHIIPNKAVNSTELHAQTTFTPQSGTEVFVGAAPGNGPLTLISVAANARVTEADTAMGCNYVIHTVDAVLGSDPPARGGLNPSYSASLATGRATAGRRR